MPETSKPKMTAMKVIKLNLTNRKQMAKLVGKVTSTSLPVKAIKK